MYSPPEYCCQSQMAHTVIRRAQLCVGFGADKHEVMSYFFVRGNEMILDAITVFLCRILNQKHAINKYAKMSSDGFFLGKKWLQMFLFSSQKNPFSEKRVLEGERYKQNLFLAFPGQKTA